MKSFILDAQNLLDDNYAKEIENIREARRKRVVVFMLTVFGDESHDELEERIFAVGGVMGTQEEWDTLSPIWLDRTGGKPFHASDCEAGKGEYEGISHEKNLKLYADLVKILTKTQLMGFGAIIDLTGYNKSFPGVVENIPYHLCFSKVVMWFARIAYLSVPQQKVKFTFDRNVRTNASSVLLYEAMEKSPNWKYGKYLDEISFTNRSDSVGIQVADLLARESMKHCDNFFIGSSGHRVRKSMQSLSDSWKYQFDFFTKEYFEGWKDQFKEFQEKAGFTVEDYKRWLLQNKLKDNLSNRHRFLLDLVRTKPDLVLVAPDHMDEEE